MCELTIATPGHDSVQQAVAQARASALRSPEAWARREDDVIRKSSTPVADCPMPESEFRPVVYVPQPRFIPGIPANQIQPPPAAPGGRVAA